MLDIGRLLIILLGILPIVVQTSSRPVLDHASPSAKARDSDSFTLRESFYHGLNDTGLLITRHPLGTLHVATTDHNSSTLVLHSQKKSDDQSVRTTDHGQTFLQSGIHGHIRGSGSEPNVSDKETIINLAKMTSNSYYEDPSIAGWLNLSNGFNLSQSFGWQTDALRGHVFANGDNSTMVISFKGTTIYPWTGTRSKDRENDNILFSCCCATQRKDPYPYGSVCGCRNSTFSCNGTCLTQEVARQDRYYATAVNVLLNVTAAYPQSDVWVVGHSLGGAMASLMGMTFDIPAVTFESPPDLLPAQRLGLALPPAKYSTTYHFGNTADPVYVGACNGYISSCSIAGFAFESQCFTGKRCVYDTVIDKGWHVNVLNHRIDTVIETVLMAYDTVPDCAPDDECIDCYNWSFYD